MEPQQQYIQKMCQKMVEVADQMNLKRLKNLDNTQDMIVLKMAREPIKITPEVFNKAVNLTKIWVKLTQLASLDDDFIIRTMTPCKQGPMVGPLLSIYQKLMNLNKQKQTSKPKLSLDRVDYFLEKKEEDYRALCIEYNLFACGGMGITCSIDKVHRQLWKQNNYSFVPPQGLQLYAKAIKNFFTLHKMNGVMVLVSSRFEALTPDMYAFQEGVEKEGVKCIIIQYSKLESMLIFDENNDVFLKTGENVSLIYFRAGSSIQYDNFWDLKEKIAFSNAVSVPWIGIQLVNQKRAQAQLSKKDVMNKYLNQEQSQFLSKNIADMWDFDTQINSQQKYNQLLKQAWNIGLQEFYLKPNAEGGGNNIIGKQGIEKLGQMSVQQRKNYILMRRIHPIQVKRTLIETKLNKEVQLSEHIVDFQLSIFGVIATGIEMETQFLQAGGYWLRVKPSTLKEARTMTGTSAMSSLRFANQID